MLRLSERGGASTLMLYPWRVSVSERILLKWALKKAEWAYFQSTDELRSPDGRIFRASEPLPADVLEEFRRLYEGPSRAAIEREYRRRQNLSYRKSSARRA